VCWTEHVARALPLGQHFDSTGKAEAVERIRNLDDVQDLVSDDVQLLTGADVTDLWTKFWQVSCERSMTDVSTPFWTALADCYRLERELGRGGMATVYLAHDLRHDRPLALKVVHPELARALGRERFLREIKLAARLQHPHILSVHDSGEAAGQLWYTMPWVEGESLRQRLLRERQLPVEDALRIAQDVASALEYAHGHGIVHRDIKPENILLHAGEAMVADFGIAKAPESGEAGTRASGGTELTATGVSLGTPTYMSPEQAAGDAVDRRTDIYALGCVLYEMLAGEPPYTGATAQALIAKRFTEPVPRVRHVRETVPVPVEQALLKALAKAPADRFASAAQFAEALTTTAAVTLPDQSVAVLPFLNLSGDPDNEYFADGITEDVIAQLSKIRALKVISRTSVMPFKQRERNLRQIGAQLGVAALLEGSVRRSRDRVRIVAQLIDTATDQHLWAETYDRELHDVFAIQSDVALRIAAALEAELSPDERARLKDHAAAGRARNLEAYEAYLKGRFRWTQHTPESLQTAVGYFELALQKDPNYALAHGAIADSWGARTFLGLIAPREAYPMAKGGVLKALELDETIAETHDLLGRVRMWFEWDWEGAERAFRRAIELNANYADVRMFYSWFFSAMQRWEEAEEQLDRALQLDPLNPLFHWYRGLALLLRGHGEEAIRQFRRTLEIDPSYLMAHSGLWMGFHQRNMREEALAEATKYFDALLDREVSDALSRGAAEGGYVRAMRLAADTLGARFGQTYVPPTRVARLYAYAGERDLALQWLEKGYVERDFEMVYLRVQPTWENLRSDPRFQDLVRRMEFPD
jgi:eukaryotic-like serine/threonine-protein kinase